tara:strand:- start:60230 stop:60724 length:495 start_codon:yes stop_codon:yes gene_type:complete
MLLPLALGAAETIEFEVGDSYLIKDKNVTLLDINYDEDKVILCINNQKSIFSDDKDKYFNNMQIDVKSINDDKAKIRIERACSNCACGDSCKNDLCVVTKEDKEVLKETTEKDTSIPKETQESNEKEIIIVSQKPAQQNNSLPLILFLILAIILIFLVVIRKRH